MKRKIDSVCLMLVVLLTLVVVGIGLPAVRAQSPNRVGLVVRFGDGSLITRCIAFGEPQISGYDVLTRSGLNIVASFDSGIGAAICAIEGTGCPVETCLTCAMPNYWSYWHLKDGAWVYSQVGASGYAVHDGDVEGWSWGEAVPPPVVPFDQICAPPPTATPLPPTATPAPPTATPPPPTATAPPPTPVVWFRLDENPIPVGACTMVRWDTANVTEVYLDGERVDPSGSLEVCPATPQEYHLRVVGVTGEQTYTLVLGVTGPTPTSTAAATPSPIPSPPPTPLAVAALTITPPTPTATAAVSVTPSVPVTATVITVTATSPTPSPGLSPSPSPPSEPAISEPSPSPSPTSQPGGPAVGGSYVVLGLIVAALGGWLIWGIVRRK